MRYFPRCEQSLRDGAGHPLALGQRGDRGGSLIRGRKRVLQPLLSCAKEGCLRPVLDLRHLNYALVRGRFKMLTHKQILSQIQPGDWFVMVDLKDTYCMEATSVFVSGCFHRGCSSSQAGDHGCLPYKLGHCQWQISCLWSLEGWASVMAHKLPEVACHLSGFELVPPNAPGLPYSCQDRQYDSGGLHKPPGGMRSHSMWLLVQCILLWVQNKFLYLREVYVSGVTNLSADFLLRHSLEFGEWRLHLSGGWSVCFQRESLLSSVVLLVEPST